MGSDQPQVPGDAGPKKITPKDVASTTAVGSAARLGAAFRKSSTGKGIASGAAVGNAGLKPKRPADANSLLTAALVVALTVGTLAAMIVLGK